MLQDPIIPGQPDAHFELGYHPTQRHQSARTADGLAAIITAQPVETRRATAADYRTPGLRLHALASDPDRDVRAAVASNPITPASLLTRLTHDPDATVAAIAQAQLTALAIPRPRR
jgi:hypothetical protein